MTGDSLDGVPVFIKWKAFGTQGDALVKLNIIANYTGGTNHNPSPMVNCKIVADRGCRVNIDTGLRMRDLRHHPGDKWNFQRYQFMGNSIDGQHLDNRITGDDFS